MTKCIADLPRSNINCSYALIDHGWFRNSLVATVVLNGWSLFYYLISASATYSFKVSRVPSLFLGERLVALIVCDIQGNRREGSCHFAAILYKLPSNHHSRLESYFFSLSLENHVLSVAQMFPSWERVSSGISLLEYAKYRFHNQVSTECIVMCFKL